MSTSKADIRGWLQEAKRQRATHMIVVCDTFAHEDYPVYVLKDQDVREVEKRFNGPSMQRVMEIYCLALDIEKQLAEHRAFHYES